MGFFFEIGFSAEFPEEGPRTEELLVDCAQVLGPWCGSLSAAELLGCHLMIAVPRLHCSVQAIYIPKTVRKPRNANLNPPPAILSADSRFQRRGSPASQLKT